MNAIESPRSADLSSHQRSQKRRRSDTVTQVPTLADIGELPLEKIGTHLAPHSFRACAHLLDHKLLPPATVASAMRGALARYDGLPPPMLTAKWDAPNWLQCAQMAAKATERPYEAEAYDDYVTRGAPSQYKFLRLQDAALTAWRCQGYLISEELDALRQSATPLRSLDLSALLFPPFPGFERATRRLSVEHVRFSTGRDATEPPHIEIPLTAFFRHTPVLRSLELVPKMYSSPMSACDDDFPLQDFCFELAQALDSPYAAQLVHLRLDFSGVRGPARPAIVQHLTEAVAKRAVLQDVSITWPG